MQIDKTKTDLYINYLLEWNKIHKLTNYNNKQDIEENIYDSIYPLKFLPEFKSVLDVGSGAGFPALFLAILMPKVKFVLVEPLIKKYSFLNFIKVALELDNVEIKKARVEELEAKKFDLITSRAVADTKVLINLVKKFIGENTTLLFYKGALADNEIDLKAQKIKRDKRVYLIIKGKDVF